MIEKIDTKDLFNLTTEERKLVIEQSVNLIINECYKISKKFNRGFNRVLSETIYNIETSKILEEQNENYELCYFYDEVVWGIHQKIKDSRKEKE